MARTIAEIQQEILIEKENHSELTALTSESKSAIWRLWVYIVATAIWIHEKIVDENALLSRPHTLHWYREQALNFLYTVGADNSGVSGINLEWIDGYFQYPELTDAQIAEYSIIKHCAISERLFDEIQEEAEQEGGNINLTDLISEFYYNQVGVLTLKVAKDVGGVKQPLENVEKRAFAAYMNQIKDAGTQIRVVSQAGNTIEINMEVYVDPLIIYTGGTSDEDLENAGKLLSNLVTEPVKDAITTYLNTLEFNGAFVPTYLVDKIQEVEGVKLPILNKITVYNSSSDTTSAGQVIYGQDGDVYRKQPFFVPSSGYFNVEEGVSSFDITYQPYNLQTDPNFNV